MNGRQRKYHSVIYPYLPPKGLQRASGMPIGRGKGVHFHALITCDLDHVDPLSLNMETAAKVKIRKLKSL